MAQGYSWSNTRDSGSYRLPGPNRLGWWAAVAMFLSVLLHVVVFFALDNMKIAFNFNQAEEMSTRPIDVRQVEIPVMQPVRSLPPEDIIKPSADSTALLEDIELLDILPKDTDIDIRPDVEVAEYALQMRNPAREGEPDALALEISPGTDLDLALPEFGREPESIEPAEVGQITVDPGAVSMDDEGLGNFTEELIRRGANGKVADGKLDGVNSLDELLDLPPNILLGRKTMLPSDLLFEFNSFELRESARVGLLKLGMLMDRNPDLYCWIEGHTDLVGGDDFNLNLSIRRAEAVKEYLVKSLRMDPEKILTRGFGRYEPLVATGSAEEQAANRRVEIRMRTTPPTDAQRRVEPKKATVVEEPPAPRAILVKPNRALPVEIVPVPRALPVADPTPPLQPESDFPEVAIPRAAPVEQEPPAAIPRAQAVEDE